MNKMHCISIISYDQLFGKGDSSCLQKHKKKYLVHELPRNLLAVPSKELPIVVARRIVDDAQEFLNRELFGEKLAFRNISLVRP